MPSPFQMLRPLVLASGSPRRREFLARLGIGFETMPAEGPEPRPLHGEEPSAYAARTAEAKAAEVCARLAGRPDRPAVLGADTSVILPGPDGGAILGKPRDAEDALRMLRLLSGRTHRVVTACCLLLDGRKRTFEGSADVAFASWPDSALRTYAESGEPLDKAGAYAIQGGGSFLVSSISGSWTSIVGLPVDLVVRALLDEGVMKSV